MIKKLMNSRIISLMLTVCLLVGILQYDVIMVSAEVDMPDCEDITEATWVNDVDKVIEIIGENYEQYHYPSITIPAGCTLNIIGARVEASEVTIEEGGNICIFNNTVGSGESAWESPGGLAVQTMYADEGARMTLGDRSNVLNLNREGWDITPVYQRYQDGGKEVKLEDITGVGDNKTNFNWKCNTFVFENSTSTGMWVSEDLYVTSNTTVDSYLCLSDGQNLFIDGGVLNCEGIVVEDGCTLALSTVYDDDGYVVNRGQLTIGENGYIAFLGGAILQIDTSVYPSDSYNDSEDTTNSWLSGYSFVTSGGYDINPLDEKYKNTVLRFRCAGDNYFVLMEDPDAITADTWKADEDKVIEIKADNSNLVKYSSIVVPEGCNLSIVGANVQVGDLDIQPGGQVTVMNNHADDKSIKSYGLLSVTGAFTYTGGSSMMCESNSNLIRYKSGYPYVAVPVYDIQQNDQQEDVLIEITNDPGWTWFEFIYDASEGANRWMRYEYTGDHYYWGDLGDAEYFDVDTLAIGEGEMVFIEGCEVKVNSLTVANKGMLGLVTVDGRNPKLTAKEGGTITFNPGAQLQIEENSVVFEQNSWLSSYSFGRFVPDGNGGQTFEALAQEDIENQDVNIRYEYISINEDGDKAFVLMDNSGDPDEPGDTNAPSKEQFDRLATELAATNFAFGDLDGEGGTTTSDLAYGIARTIYDDFKFEEGRHFAIGKYIGITKRSDKDGEIDRGYINMLQSCVQVEQTASSTFTMYDTNGAAVALPLYNFTIDFSTISGLDDSTIETLGKYTFAGKVVMFAEEGASQSTYTPTSIYKIAVGIRQNDYNTKWYLRDSREVRQSGDAGDLKYLTDTQGNNLEDTRAITIIDSNTNFDYSDQVIVFGNFTSANYDEVLSPDGSRNLYVVSFHGGIENNQTQGELPTKFRNFYIGGKVAAYTSDFKGLYLDCGYQDGSAYVPAYGFGDSYYPIYDVADSDSSIDVFFGYDKIKLIPMAVADGTVKQTGTISSITNLADKASGVAKLEDYVAQAGTDTEADTIEIYTNACESIDVSCTDSKSATYNFKIKRIGVIVSAGRTAGDSRSTLKMLHGHGPATTYDLGQDTEYAIYATYYYDVYDGISEGVDLFVTMEYPDGRVVRKVLNSVANSFGGQVGDTTTYISPMADYVLYTGTVADAPTRVSAIAIPQPDTTGATNYRAGAKFGNKSAAVKDIEIKD